MNRNFLAVLIIVLFSTFVFSQDDEVNDDVEREISICQPELTEHGRRSSFRFGYNYIVQANENGLIEDVRYLKSKTNYESLADSSSVIPCIKTWKLKRSTKYRVYISFGTNSGPNFLIISNKEEKIRINV